MAALASKATFFLLAKDGVIRRKNIKKALMNLFKASLLIENIKVFYYSPTDKNKKI